MRSRIVAVVVMAGTVAWTFLPAVWFTFLNWDDQAVVTQNTSLAGPGVVAWAFTTTYMEHYQPLGWLAWAAARSLFGLNAVAFHSLNVAAHVACVLLVWAAGRMAMAAAMPSMAAPWRERAAVAAALLFGLHPLRVEVVAWISALPYALAVALLLASWLAYRRATRTRASWPGAALLLYAASLAVRPVGLGFPAVLIIVDTLLFKTRARASAATAWPFAVLATAAAVTEGIARSPGLNDTPWSYRLQSAAAAPFVYLWHTAWPVALTPLDVLPANPAASAGLLTLALAGLGAACAAAWWGRARYPALSAAWASYLALLVPAAGLIPSGLQVTADRYSYLPGVVVAVTVAGAGARWAERRGAARLFGVGVVVAASALMWTTRETLAPWSDSVSLWTHVIARDPANDVGLYNLGSALEADGRTEAAEERYREVLRVRPEHAEARANLNGLEAARFEREGNDRAGRGDLEGAVERYGEAIARDRQRTHSHAARGMALASLGRSAEAIPSLREAVSQGVDDPNVPSALGVLLVESGQAAEARTVLEGALAAHPNDVGVAHNLARLLVTTPGFTRADAATALQLAGTVVGATGGRDPRSLETLASALAANGRLVEARTANARAAALARDQGDHELAVQITARGRHYRNPGQ